MNSINSRLSMAALTLVAVSLACEVFGRSLSDSSITPPVMTLVGPARTPEATVEPTATVEDLETPEATAIEEVTPEPGAAPEIRRATLPPPLAGPETLDLASLASEPIVQDFSEGYRLSMSWTDPENGPQQAETVYAYQQQISPENGWSLKYKDDNPFLASNYETALIANQGYSAALEMPCQLVPLANMDGQSPRGPFEQLFEGLTGTAGRAEAEVEVDGLLTDIYPLEAGNLLSSAEIVLKGSAANEEGEFTSSSSATIALVEEGTSLESGKLYLARQGGFVKRIELVYSHTADENDAPFAQPGSLMERTLVYDFIPAGDDTAALLPPETCPIPGLPTNGSEPPAAEGGSVVEVNEIPRLPDAQQVVDMGDTLTYVTSTSVTEAIDFYKLELAAQGWTLDEEITLGTLATLEFSQGGQSLSLTALETGDGVMLTIVIS